METLAAQRIADAERILAICHVSPDGDAVGSLLGLGLSLRKLGKEVVMACADPVPVIYHHLPHRQEIVRSPTGHFDLVISLDCSDLDRLGKAYDAEALSGVPIVNVDHHATNIHFGTVNWVDTTAAATAQMLVRLIEVMGVPLDPEIATCLLNGILTDTLCFRTPATTAQVMEAAIKLMDAGASLSQLTDHIFNHRPLTTIKMWSMALQELHLEGRILWSQITQSMRRYVGYKENGDAGLVNFLNTANEADITVVFDEMEDGRVNISMRAGTGYDVSKVALALGGGGHPQAAGCTLRGPLEDVRERVLSLLHQAWEKQTRRV